jgi:hypothetical protein
MLKIKKWFNLGVKMDPVSGDVKLSIKIDTTKPVELIDLTTSFLGLLDEYSRYVVRQPDIPHPEEIKLFIKEIRSGSIYADIVAITPGVMQCITYGVTLISFTGYLKRAYEYLKGATEEKPEIDKKGYENLSNFINPVTKDNASQINCTTYVNNETNVNFVLNSTEANAAQNRARKALDEYKAMITGRHNNVLLYWYQARGNLKGQAGDIAVIESISSLPVKTIFAVDGIKKSMILGEDNPFGMAYIVDVMVETVQEKPRLYNIITYHEKIEK